MLQQNDRPPLGPLPDELAHCGALLLHLIERCWRTRPSSRPEMKEVIEELARAERGDEPGGQLEPTKPRARAHEPEATV